ncbi:MAG: membrane protein [Cenarchaeum symbiont of Oopsacas minuta]|nr:membrane protein [Cenarchaeum symbiont of Oopsacas minuta]
MYIITVLQRETTVETKTELAKLLVICVDRDNDVGEKTGLATPVVGRNACIEAAQKLALEDPEDADSNAIFSAIKTYEDLISRGYTVQVIVVAGVEHRGVQADEKIVSEIKSVLKTYNAGGAIIVSDGEDDESVIPIIQNVLPIVSVQRVVMKVSRTVEYSYAVFAKYVKMLAYDSKYSKFFLGVPGMLLLIGGIATAFGYTAEIFAVLVSILGAAFVIRAFDIDKAWTSWTKPSPSGFIRLFTVIAGIVLIISSFGAGLSVANLSEISAPSDILANGVIVGEFLSGALPIMWVGLGTLFAGTLLSNWLGGVQRQINDSLRIIALAALYPTLAQFAHILITNDSTLTLVLPLVAGLTATVIAAIVLFKRYRSPRTHIDM